MGTKLSNDYTIKQFTEHHLWGWRTRPVSQLCRVVELTRIEAGFSLQIYKHTHITESAYGTPIREEKGEEEEQ